LGRSSQGQLVTSATSTAASTTAVTPMEFQRTTACRGRSSRDTHRQSPGANLCGADKARRMDGKARAMDGQIPKQFSDAFLSAERDGTACW
jgi:hypothetical protein